MSISEKSSHSVFVALNEVHPIATALVSMWHMNNMYLRPPMLRFKFKDIPKLHPIYTKLLEVVQNFSGEAKWTIITDSRSPNYLILPEVFLKFVDYENNHNKEEFINTDGEYNKMIDMAIVDASRLADCIINNKDYLLSEIA